MSTKFLDLSDDFIEESDPQPTAEELAEMDVVELDDPNELADNFKDTDPVSLYLHEVGSVPPLSEEEVETLARDLHRSGNAQEERAAKRARRKLTEHHLRLVISIAKRYVGRGILFLDLIQEGSLGLMEAMDHFDGSESSPKFSCYTAWYIRRAILRALEEQDRSVRSPVQLANDFTRVRDLLRRRSGHEPEPQDIAKAMDLPVETIEELFKLTDTSSDEPVPSSEEELGRDEAFEMRAQLEELLDTLDEREADILRMRFGLSDGRTHSAEEVAATLGLTAGRVTQLEKKALRTLKPQMTHPQEPNIPS